MTFIQVSKTFYVHIYLHMYLSPQTHTIQVISIRKLQKTFSDEKGHMCSVAQSFLTLCDLMDCSPPGSFVHGISQARILEWVTISFSRGSSQPRNGTGVSCSSRQILLTTDLGSQTRAISSVQFSRSNLYLCQKKDFKLTFT